MKSDMQKTEPTEDSGLNYPEPLQSIGWKNFGIGLPANQLSLLSLGWFAAILGLAYGEHFSLQQWTSIIASISVILAIAIEWRTLTNPSRRFPRLWALFLLLLSLVNVSLIIGHQVNPESVKNILQNVSLIYPLCPVTWATGAALLTLSPRVIHLTPTDSLLHWIAPLTAVLASALIVTVWVNRPEPKQDDSTDRLSPGCMFQKATSTPIPQPPVTSTDIKTVTPTETGTTTSTSDDTQTVTETITETMTDTNTSTPYQKRLRADSVDAMVNVGEKLNIAIQQYFYPSNISFSLKLDTKPTFGSVQLDKEISPTLLTYTASTKPGNDTIFYSAKDEFGNNVDWYIAIVVNGAPELKSDMLVIKVNKNKESGLLNINDYLFDPEGDGFEVSQCLPDRGKLEYPQKSHAVFKYIPDIGFSGKADIKCEVKDEHDAGQTVRLPVEIVNTPPVIAIKEKKYTLQSGSELSINIISDAQIYDPDDDELKLKAVSSLDGLSLNGSQFKYVAPVLSTDKTYKVTYEVSDGDAAPIRGVFTITVQPKPRINSPPPSCSYNNGKNFIDNGDYQRALEEFQCILNSSPNKGVCRSILDQLDMMTYKGLSESKSVLFSKVYQLTQSCSTRK